MTGRERRDDRIETRDESQRGRARKVWRDPVVLLRAVGGAEPRAAPPPDRVRDSDRAGAPARHRLLAAQRPGLSVVGVDGSEAMIRRAARGTRLPNLEFRRGTVQGLSFRDEFGFALSVLS